MFAKKSRKGNKILSAQKAAAEKCEKCFYVFFEA